MKEKKDYIIRIRCTRSDKYDWRAKSKLAGLPLSVLIRQSLNRVRVWTPEARYRHSAVVRHLASIGNNLNQIARSLNQHAEPLASVMAIALLQDIQRYCQKVATKDAGDQDVD